MGSHYGVYVESLENTGFELLIQVFPIRKDIKGEPGLVLFLARQRSGLDLGQESGGDLLDNPHRRKRKGDF